MRSRSALIVCFIALGLLGACGATRLAYDYADNYFIGAVQDYFDPTPEQSRAVRATADELLVWHRQQELPLYVAMFRAAADKTRDGLTEEEVAWGIQQIKQRYAALATRIFEANAPLLTDLKEQNFAALAKKFDANNAKLHRTYFETGSKRRDERRVERVRTQFERWVGPLNARQQSIITAWVAAAPNAGREWYRDRTDRQAEMMAVLRAEREPARLASKLTALWLGKGPGAERRARSEVRLAGLIVAIDRTLSAEQRAQAVKRMRKYSDDFRLLND